MYFCPKDLMSVSFFIVNTRRRTHGFLFATNGSYLRPSTFYPRLFTLDPGHFTLDPRLFTLDPRHLTLDPRQKPRLFQKRFRNSGKTILDIKAFKLCKKYYEKTAAAKRLKKTHSIAILKLL